MPAASPSYATAHEHAVPARAERLAYAGLLPFVLGSVLSLLVHDEAHPYVLLALSAYAGVVVAFLGGVHWGVGMLGMPGSTAGLTWSVIPSLVACVAMVMPAYAGLVILGGLLLICYLVDRRLYPGYGLASWLTLRFRLTLGAVLSCFIAAGGA